MPKKELKQAIREWLKESGYPLEMQVANAFRKASFRVSQSTYYADPDTEEHREIDVIAADSLGVGGGRSIRLEIVVECKSSRDKPWVVFTSGLKPHNPALSIAGAASVCNPIGEKLHRLLMSEGIFKPLELFALSSRPGYGIVQALGQKGSSDPSYTAQMQAAKAAIALCAQDNEGAGALRLGLRFEPARIVVPIIVLDGRLFTACLEDSGEDIELTETKAQWVNLGNPDIGSHLALLKVITKEGLADFVSNAVSARDAIFGWCKNNVDKIEGELKERATHVGPTRPTGYTRPK